MFQDLAAVVFFCRTADLSPSGATILPAERNYSVGEQEQLAVVKAFLHWRRYLEGALNNVVITIHKPKVILNTRPPDALSRRQCRWQEILSCFDFKWEWMKGSTNLADPVSRQAKLLTTVAEFETPSVELLQNIQDGYAQDSLFLDASKTKHFSFDGKFWRKDSCIIVPDCSDLRRRCIALHHDPPYSRHLGIPRTLALLTRHFWWPGIYAQVKELVTLCDTCQRTKTLRERAPGLLHPLQIPDGRWQSISTDLVIQLPESLKGNNAIIVSVDRLSKMVHLAPTTTSVTAHEYAQIMLERVYAHHGMPSDVVSDRDPRFTSDFYKEFCTLLGIRQNMSVAFHPQTDGQTERMNQYVEAILRTYVNPEQNNWDVLLPLVEFAINNAYQASIKTTPFFLNHGDHPRTPTDLHLGLRGTTDSRLKQLAAALERAKACIADAQTNMAKYANRHR